MGVLPGLIGIGYAARAKKSARDTVLVTQFLGNIGKFVAKRQSKLLIKAARQQAGKIGQQAGKIFRDPRAADALGCFAALAEGFAPGNVIDTNNMSLGRIDGLYKNIGTFLSFFKGSGS